MVPFSLLFGNETVKQTVDHIFTGSFVNYAIFKEINETIAMDKVELDLFAEDILDRFRNPFIKHNLSSIALNSIDKFKVRVLPSILEYVKKFDKTPTNLTFSFACLIRFYQGTWNGEKLPLDDNPEIITFFDEIWKTNSLEEVVQKTLSNINFWGKDLTKIVGLSHAVLLALKAIEDYGIEKGFAHFSLEN
jgi:tagaturonate reductase